MTTEQAFHIAIPDEKIASLREKLANTTLPDEIEDAGWDYGVPLADVKRLLARWQGGYDWRVHEKALNDELPQFTRDIEVDGFGALNIHYVHQKSTVAGAIPLLFVHGWPGSFIEVRKILPLLTAASPDHPSFHVVALGLPGYGFSEGVTKRGFKVAQYAELGNKLMLALGYNEYVTQGGDWGSTITRKIASAYGGAHSKAWHTNMPSSEPPTLLANPISYLQWIITPYTPEEKRGWEVTKAFRTYGRGYSAEQITVPQTIGYSLADSPVGLLAWIYEKLVDWSDNYNWEDDEVLTWISIYWFSRAGPASSARIYYEILGTRGTPAYAAEQGPAPTIPLGVSYFPAEHVNLPRKWMNRAGNVVYSREHTAGGHFAAHEQPEALVDDVRKMFGKGGPAYGVVPGKDGY
ncbi:hypothetical protein PLICRDRAFT_135850 [Plicaturopsis crispa FD-325 SS-3]|nr:hypothetical protein PLICRDRAFT_135850 [Plicaturopsis crispa FD-325 SS-3]